MNGIRAGKSVRASLGSMDRRDAIIDYGLDGFMLAIALQWAVETRIYHSYDNRTYFVKAGETRDTVFDPHEIKHDYVRAAVLHHQVGPCQIDVNADVPAQMGLGGSCALMLSLNHALWSWKHWSVPISAQDEVRLAAYLETGPTENGVSLNKSNGVQDYLGSLAINLTGSPLISMPIRRAVDVNGWVYTRPVYEEAYTFPAESVAWLSDSLMIFRINERVATAAQHIDSQKPSVELMRQMSELTRDAARALVDYNISRFSAAAKESWALKIAMDPGVIPAHAQPFYNRVRDLEAMKLIRIMGAGGGGCFLILCDDPKARQQIINYSEEDDAVWHCKNVSLAKQPGGANRI